MNSCTSFSSRSKYRYLKPLVEDDIRAMIIYYENDSLNDINLSLKNHFVMQYEFYDRYWSDSAKIKRANEQYERMDGAPEMIFFYILPPQVVPKCKRKGKIGIWIHGINLKVFYSSGAAKSTQVTSPTIKDNSCQGYFFVNYANLASMSRMEKISEGDSMIIEVMYEYILDRPNKAVFLGQKDTLVFNIPYE